MRSMRGSTSAVNGFPLIFRVIFRFIFESAFGSGLRYMMVTKFAGKSKGWGWARFARRCWVLGSGCWRRLCAIGRICAELCVEGAIRVGCKTGQTKPLPLKLKELACGAVLDLGDAWAPLGD